MTKPIVSIITPAFNCEKTINETYESIKNQSFSSWEWIVVEDCSTDNSYEIIEKIAKKDKRVVLLQTKENSGAAVSRNIGIENARGKYIAFLDSDDVWEVEKLDHQIKFMKDNNIALSFTNYYVLLKNQKKKTRRAKKEVITYRMLLRKNNIGCLTAMYDAELIGKVYMPLDCEKREDHGAWLDITKRGINAYRLDEFLATYRIGGNSVSSNKFKMMKYQYRVYRKHEKFSVIKSLYYLMVCSINRITKKY